LVSELRRQLGGALSLKEPSGGMALWAKVIAGGISSSEWAERALERKVLVHPGKRFRFDGREAPFLRVGFAPFGGASSRHVAFQPLEPRVVEEFVGARDFEALAATRRRSARG
jgi:hypothetical protein